MTLCFFILGFIGYCSFTLKRLKPTNPGFFMAWSNLVFTGGLAMFLWDHEWPFLLKNLFIFVCFHYAFYFQLYCLASRGLSIAILDMIASEGPTTQQDLEALLARYELTNKDQTSSKIEDMKRLGFIDSTGKTTAFGKLVRCIHNAGFKALGFQTMG